MKKSVIIIFLLTAASQTLLFSLTGFYLLLDADGNIDESRFLSYVINPARQELKFYWKDKDGKNYANFKNLKLAVEKNNKELIFAMNGGMYKKDLSPQGLFIENGITQTSIDRVKEGYGNFYLQPNGVFYLTESNKPVVCTTINFENDGNIKYATQSGPMLLIEGEMHPKFKRARQMYI